MSKQIARALLSVSNKEGIVALAQFLEGEGVEILSTGGTAALLKEHGVAVKGVSDHTGFPEIMDGRVKTLHPNIHGGILAKRSDANHMDAMEKHAIAPIDLVVINLYPFAQTVASGASFDACVEQIDIGGPAMVRASAKNHADVTIVVDPERYPEVMEEMKREGGGTSADLRRVLAEDAFTHTARYDAAISQWLASQAAGDLTQDDDWPLPRKLHVSADLDVTLRYGENAHQKAALYVTDEQVPGVVTAEQLQGKELSYNNINDADAAWELVSEFERPAVALIKHANPCGVALGADLTDAFGKALACDPVSAYGGILAVNRPVDAALVEAIGKLFLEVVIAPGFDDAAKEILSAKKNLRLLETGSMPDAGSPRMVVKSVGGGLLVQQRDHMIVDDATLKVTSKRAPNEQELADLKFAFAVCKHVKSNAIVMAKDGATVGIGAGQMSRVDSVRIARRKAEDAKLSTEGAVMASDAFFPFDDNVHHAAEAGIVALIHPGGSIRDEEVIAAADKYSMAMVMTGIRHFRH